MLTRRAVAFLTCLALTCLPVTMSAQIKSGQDVVQAASKVYYNLPNEGMVEFQCSAVPDWQVILAAELHKEIPPDHPAVKTLQGIHFWLSLDQGGSPKLSHKLDSPITDPQSQDGINQTISGIEQVLGGYSQSVAPFLFTSMLPKPGDKYSYEARGTGHFLSFKEESGDVALTLRQDLTISEAHVVTPEMNVTMHPQFVKSEKGFLVTEIDSEYKLANDTAPSKVAMKIEYATVQGLRLPSKLTVDTETGGAVHKMEIAFTDFEVKKKK